MDRISAFLNNLAAQGREPKVFDWDEAARRIKERKPLTASAGLSQDWFWTGGTIFSNGEPDLEDHTYLSSTWATPELSLDGIVEPCFRLASEVPDWDSGTKWPESALNILRS